mgnify:CR=1 FL=1
MGGHRAGNIASEMTVTDLGREWINTDYTELSQIRDWLLVTLEAENRKVYESVKLMSIKVWEQQ